jgi:LEA14-like dessication related protein
MKKSKIRGRRFAPFLAAFLLLILMSGCAGVRMLLQPPHVSLVDISPVQINLFEQRYRLQLRIQNPNNYTLPIGGMQYKVYLNDKEFAEGVSRQAVTVPAFGEAIVVVDVTSDLGKILQQVRQLGTGKMEKLRYRLTGGIQVSHQPIRLPFHYEGEIDLNWATPSSP